LNHEEHEGHEEKINVVLFVSFVVKIRIIEIIRKKLIYVSGFDTMNITNSKRKRRKRKR